MLSASRNDVSQRSLTIYKYAENFWADSLGKVVLHRKIAFSSNATFLTYRLCHCKQKHEEDYILTQHDARAHTRCQHFIIKTQINFSRLSPLRKQVACSLLRLIISDKNDVQRYQRSTDASMYVCTDSGEKCGRG